MARNKREMPTFFSFEIGPLRGLAESMSDEEWGRWSKNALNDLSIGCVKKDTDPQVKKMFETAKIKMENEYQRKRKWYEENKAGNTAENPEPQDTEEAPAPRTEPERRQATPQQQHRQQAQPVAQKAAVKKPGQVVWGTFENVYLSHEEFNELARLVGNLNSTREMIDSLSAKLEDGSTTSSNHYATLTYWANYRKEKAAEAVETAKARAAANAEAFGNVDRRTPYQKNQDELHQLYVLTSEKLKELK